jgi:hypothetical protein
MVARKPIPATLDANGLKREGIWLPFFTGIGAPGIVL